MPFSNWLRRMFCAHEWVEIQRATLNYRHGGEIAGMVFVLRCKHCGEITSRRFT